MDVSYPLWAIEVLNNSETVRDRLYIVCINGKLKRTQIWDIAWVYPDPYAPLITQARGPRIKFPFHVSA